MSVLPKHRTARSLSEHVYRRQRVIAPPPLYSVDTLLNLGVLRHCGSCAADCFVSTEIPCIFFFTHSISGREIILFLEVIEVATLRHAPSGTKLAQVVVVASRSVPAEGR